MGLTERTTQLAAAAAARIRAQQSGCDAMAAVT